ncbi:MAG: AMP-binding protein [Alistipes sp.]|nr:AMP-binding protein [Alistipes sp.]
MKLNTLYEVLQNSVKEFANRIAFSQWRGAEVSYEEVGSRVEKIQEMLVDADIQPGDRIAILSSSVPNWGVAYFAITSAGYVVVPIMPDFTSEDVDRIVEHSESKALFVSDKLFSKVSKKTAERLNIVVRTKNLGVISQNVKGGNGQKRIPQSDDLAAIIYTSGTTSQPKGVMLTHYNLCSQLAMIDKLYMVYKEDVFLSVLPLAHTYECTIGLILAFYHGAHVVYLDKAPTVSVLLPALREVRPTIMLTVPLIIEKIYRGAVLKKFTSNALMASLYKVGFIRRMLHRMAGKKLKKTFGGRVRFFGIGGAKLDSTVEQFLLEAKFIYDIGYGLTETAPLLAGAVDGMLRLGSTGPLLEGVEGRIENPNAEGIGELVVKSPSQMLGYYKNEEATREVFTEDGWFRTGDLACFDKDGWLYIKGRLKNMILGPSGENIYPEDIESVLNQHVFISESLVTEQEGHLVALVYFDKEALEARYAELVDSWHQKKSEWEKFRDEMMKDIKEYVNARVNRNSRIAEVVEEEQEFVKTPSKKIRRFLYDKRVPQTSADTKTKK